MMRDRFSLGDEVGADLADEFDGRPVVLQVQPDFFVRVDTPEALASWEESVRATTGLKFDGSRMAGSATESCSAGCSDDCDVC